MIKKVIGISAIILVGFVAFCAYMVLWTGSTKEIVGVADSLRIPSDWKLTNERITPPRHICMDGNACPSLGRWYEVDYVSDPNQAAKDVLNSSPDPIQIDEKCNNLVGENYICHISQKRSNGFVVSIYIQNLMYDESNNGKTSISVSVEKYHKNE